MPLNSNATSCKTFLKCFAKKKDNCQCHFMSSRVDWWNFILRWNAQSFFWAKKTLHVLMRVFNLWHILILAIYFQQNTLIMHAWQSLDSIQVLTLASVAQNALLASFFVFFCATHSQLFNLFLQIFFKIFMHRT